MLSSRRAPLSVSYASLACTSSTAPAQLPTETEETKPKLISSLLACFGVC